MKLFQFLFLLSILAFSSIAQAQYRIDTLAQAPAIGFPVCIAFPPDGSNRIFFSEKNAGRVRIIRHDSLLTTPFVTVSVTNSGEQGLLGLTFHPNYPDTPYIYIFYTRSVDRANMVVRYTDQNGVGVSPDTLMVIPRLNGASNHNGGNIHFGPDGKLYVTVGENADPANSQDTSNSNKRGKIHRINADGSIPLDNPFPGNSLFVYGCRNSFDFTFDLPTGKMYSSENGPSCNDEVNLIVAGGNYGWPNDGNCSYSGNPQYKRPLYYWPSNLPAVTGITVYRGSAFPALNGKMLVSCYNQSSVFQFNLNASGDSITSAPTTFLNYGSALDDVDVGPDGYIYIANGSYDGTSHLLRLRPIISVPPTPLLISPLNGAVNQARRPTLSWHKSTDAATYHLQVSADSSFSTFIFNDSTLTDTTKLLSPLSYYTQYFWRVKAINSAGKSSFTSAWKFTTIILTPTIPVLASPLNQATELPTDVTLVWYSSDRAETYHLLVSTDSLFGSTLYDVSSLTDTFKLINLLDVNTTYYWKVNATNAGGTSSFSVAWNFTTAGIDTTETIAINNRWNLLSLPVYIPNHTKSELFPGAISNAFEFVTNIGYIVRDTLTNGKGFWLKYPDSSGLSNTLTGGVVLEDTINVVLGWNLIGSISDSLQGISVQSLPPGIIESSFYGFNNGYISTPNVIAPGRGYWVKVLSDGKIVLAR